MALLDVLNVYDGTTNSPSYPPSGAITDFTPNALTAGTVTGQKSICHNQGFIPLGATTGNTANGVQFVEPFVGEAQVLVLKVITAPGSGSAGAITANFITDQVAALNDTPTVLATLSIPETATADTYYVLELTPNINFEIWSGTQYIVPAGQTVGVAAWLAPKKSLDFIPNYINGWVVLS